LIVWDFSNFGLRVSAFTLSMNLQICFIILNPFEPMPFVSVTTNQSLSRSDKAELLTELSFKCAAILGKSEDYVMVRLNLGESIFFAGTDEPALFAELFSIGLSAMDAPTLSFALCKFLSERLAIAPKRIYLNFHDVPREMWGWNRSTFAKN
jgi:phenylpyruvate tautomerase PptA (4-oxalocrotonate tautomerase family)